jgi:hypothetical protein
MRRLVLLRVGIDAGCGSSQGPLFPDQTFEFICIPDGKRADSRTYGNTLGRYGRLLVEYFPPGKRKQMAGRSMHVDPEFETFTYGDPTTPKKSLRHLTPGDFLVFYCGLQEWDTKRGWNAEKRPALYLAGYFEVLLAGMATDFGDEVVQAEFAGNMHVRHRAVYELQRKDLVLVKGGPGSRLLKKAYCISVEGKDRNDSPLKVLSPDMREVFGDFREAAVTPFSGQRHDGYTLTTRRRP